MGDWTKVWTWPWEMGLLVVTRPAEIGLYVDLLRLCDHDGTYMDGKRGRLWVEPGCALVSERFLARRWNSNKTKVGRFLDWCFDYELFYHSDPDPEGTWLRPHDGVTGPLNGPQDEPQDGPLNGPKNQKYISRSWYLSRQGKLGRERGCGGESGEGRGFDPRTWVLHPKVKFPAHLNTTEVIEVIDEWLEYRAKEKHLAVTSHRPLNLIFDEIGGYQPAQFVKAVRFAMGKGWQSIERAWVEKHIAPEPHNVLNFSRRNEPVQKSRDEVIAEAESILSKGGRK